MADWLAVRGNESAAMFGGDAPLELKTFRLTFIEGWVGFPL
jgi:hypothetical protein